MKHSKLAIVLGLATMSYAVAHAQMPTVTVDPSRHGNLAHAQESVIQAYSSISEAQRENDSHLGGHAQRAKELLAQANQEIGLAGDQADANQGEMAPPSASPAAPPASAPAPANINISGNWTIYAYNVAQPGSSLKQVQINQDGNVLTGNFRGPNQKGHLQGWINGNHVEFSTDTRDVLTFRGEVTSDGMSGMYGIHGEHAPWKAQRN
ncbi:hypothetical protein [Terriglobus roseus]|uniref:Uncharacterized protein n=1 Tax=Terriglobus roseus TaxID=392734 RepID=A0A1G7JA25_9BACT|nr:hypothetical protein [Terriglobus roseus]SDF21812.1 hypothetical protein SAMN05444167_1744 [Terriglobus roseus]